MAQVIFLSASTVPPLDHAWHLATAPKAARCRKSKPAAANNSAGNNRGKKFPLGSHAIWSIGTQADA
jgi:hypothetical protein